MRACKHVNQRVRGIGEKNGNLSRVFQKQKRKKHMKKLSLINHFKIEFLLPFSCCRKVLGKMPEWSWSLSW